MKTLSFLTLAAALAPALAHGQAQDDYVNWVRQIQTVDTVSGASLEISQDTYVDTEGRSSSPLTVPLGGAVFQLWTLNTVTGESWLLDTDVVGSTRPAAVITIDSQDSYQGVARTRADIPFTVITDYLNLQETGEGVAPELTRVRSYQYLQDNPSGSEAITVVRDKVISENGSITRSNLYTQLLPDAGEEAYQVQGVEHFAVEMFSDTGEDTTVIATNKIEVFPLTTGNLSNFGDETSWTRIPEFVGVNVDDAYPGSQIIFQVEVTKASADENAPPLVVNLLQKPIGQVTSEDLQIQFSEFALLNIENDDKLNFQLISKTVFDEVILSEELRTIDFDIFIRAGINSLSE